MINEITEAILLARDDPAQLPRIASLAQSIAALSNEDVDELLDRLLDFGDELRHARDTGPQDMTEAEGRLHFDQLIQPLVDKLVQRELKLAQDQDNPERIWPPTRYQNIQDLYRLTPTQSDLRNHLLRWLAVEGHEQAMQIWADLICDDPPEHRLGIVLAFSPLLQPEFEPPEGMLSQLINHATSHSQIAPAVFDLFNYFYRNGMLEEHPAEQRIDALTELLGLVAGQLGSCLLYTSPSPRDRG